MSELPTAAAELTVTDAERLLFREARLLDETRYEQWLELFTDDGLYWLPVSDEEGVDPRSSVSLIYDDAERREERVWRTLHTPVLDQNPRSRTVHAVSNVEVEPGVDGDALVYCVQQITELRSGGRAQVGLNTQRQLAARCTYRLRHVDGDWRIALKKVVLINADQPIFNLTFVV